MKANKVLIIIQLLLMYIAGILMFVSALTPISEETEQIIRALFFTGLGMAVAVAVYSCAILIPSFISIFKKNNVDMTRFTMIIKLAAIPWYILNFIFCVFLIAGMLNPFMMIAIPLMILILVSLTYIDLLPVSVNNVAVIISDFRAKTLKPNGFLIVGMVFHFIFCLDVLGSIFTFVNYKKNKIENIKTVSN